MNSLPINTSYAFTVDTVRFSVDIDPTYYSRVGEEAAARGLHYHPKYEIYFLLEEGLEMDTERGKLSLPASIAVVPPFFKHRVKSGACYRFQFSFENKGGESEFAKCFETSFSPCEITLIPTIKSEMRVYLDELGYLSRTSSCINEEIAVSTLKLILFHVFVYKVVAGDRGSERRSSSSYTAIIEETLNRYAQDPEVELNLDFMSRRLCLGKKQTARIILSSYQRSLSELVNERRLSIAVDLILHTSLSMSEIAARANFRSENYFYTRFKRAFGKTPLKYRKDADGGVISDLFEN